MHDESSADEDAADDEGADATDELAFGQAHAVALRWQVPAGSGRIRADLHLCAKIPRLSRTRAQRIIARGDFRGPKGALKPATRLAAGDAVELWRIPPDSALPPERAPRVLYEDDDLVVLDKGGDLAVHPSARYLFETVTAFLRSRAHPEAPAHPCHRLDRETSGVLICAKRRPAERAWKSAFAAGEVKKQYLAVVRGHLNAAHTIDCPLALQGERGLVRIRMVRDPAGLPSRTQVVPIAHDEVAERTLVLALPLTGRQHQIRAHLADAGHPIVGDKLYAMGDPYFDAFTRFALPADAPPLEHVRHALHAYEAQARIEGKVWRFRAPFPAELASLLPSLRHAPWMDRLARGELGADEAAAWAQGAALSGHKE